MKNKPFFFARNINQQVYTRGQTSCALGHILENKSQQPEHGPADGVFAKWHWDGKRLTVQNDKYGFYPLYYYQKNNEIAVSSSMVKLIELAADKELDYKALSVFIRMGFFLKEDTPFKYIKALPPNADFSWEDSKLSVSGGYSFEKPLTSTKEKAMENLAVLFKQAMKKRIPGNGDCIVPLSGGRDSRRILFELIELGVRPKMCVTYEQYPTRSQEDVRIAGLLTDRLNIPHKVLPQGPSRFQDELRKNLLTGFCSNEHTHTLTMADFLRGKTKTIYDGIAAMWLESFLIVREHVELYQMQKYDELARQLLKRWSHQEEVIKSVFNPHQYQLMAYDCAFEYLVQELKVHAQAANPLCSFHFYNRTRREINLIPFAILDDIPQVFSPYLDHDLSRFLSSLPAEIVLDGDFHSKAIYSAYPQFADIPFETKKLKKQEAVEYRIQFTNEFLNYYFAKGGLGSRFLQKKFMYPRILRSLASPAYRKEFSWVPFSFPLYFLQLEEIMKRN